MTNAAVIRPARADWLQGIRKSVVAGRTQARPVRLLFVATSAGRGGIERHSVRLAACLERRGASVTYACRPGGFLEELCLQSGVDTHPLVVRNSGDLRAALSLARVIRTHGINIVHAHSRRDFVVSALGVAWSRCRLRGRGERPRLMLHAHLIKGFGTPAWLSGRFFERAADAVLAVSAATREFLIGVHGFRPSFVSVLHNGVEVDAFDVPALQCQEWRTRVRRQWGLPEDARIVGMIGGLGAKGQETLLKVAPRVLALCPDAHFVFAGPEGEAGGRLRLLRLVASGRIAARVLVTGEPESVPAMLAALDVLAHLPRQEAFGLVLAEAMAAGLPVVAADVGGCAEVVEDGVTGTLVRPGDDAGLVEALAGTLDRRGTASGRRMAQASRRRARGLFSIQKQVEGLEALYSRMLGLPDT